MERKDYERRPPPPTIPIQCEESCAFASGLQILVVAENKDSPRNIGIFLDVPDCPSRLAFIVRNAEDMDEIIGQMIASRNTVWPSPGDSHA